MRFPARTRSDSVTHAPDISISGDPLPNDLWTVLDMAEKRIDESRKRISSLSDELFENRSKFADKVPDFAEQQDPEMQLADLELDDDDDVDDIFGDDDEEEGSCDPEELLAQMKQMQQKLNELEETLNQSDKIAKELEEQEEREAQKQKMTLDQARNSLMKKCNDYIPERKRLLESIAMSGKTDAEKVKEINRLFLNSDFEADSFWDVWEKAQSFVMNKYSDENSIAPVFAWKRLFDLVTGNLDNAETINELKKSFLNPSAETLWGVLDKAQAFIGEKYPKKNSFARGKAWDELVSLSSCDKPEAEKIEEIKKSFLNPKAWALLDILDKAQNTILEKYPDKSSFAQTFALIELMNIFSSDKTDMKKIEEIEKSFISPTNGTTLWDVVQSAQESLLERGLDAAEYRKLASPMKNILQSGKSDEERIAEIQKQPQFRSSLSEMRHGILNDVAEVVRTSLLKRFPDKDSIARKSAMGEFDRIVSDDNSSVEKRITMLINRFMDGTLTISLEMIQSALRGDLAAQFNLAQAYANGSGFGKNADKARRWYLMSASKGYTDAQAALGDIYMETNKKEAANWYRKAAESGNVNAQFALGELYSGGELDCSDSKTEAKKWYRQAADNGHVEAMFKCGRIQEAANAGHPEAMYMKALMFAESQGFDLFRRKEAIEMFRKAFQKGSRKAGVICEQYGKMEEYIKEAQAGDPKAQYRLGLCYEKCEEKGFSKVSLVWFTKAAQSGHEEAMKKLSARAISGAFNAASGFFKWLKS